MTADTSAVLFGLGAFAAASTIGRLLGVAEVAWLPAACAAALAAWLTWHARRSTGELGSRAVQTLVEQMPIAVAMFDLDKRLLACSRLWRLENVSDKCGPAEMGLHDPQLDADSLVVEVGTTGDASRCLRFERRPWLYPDGRAGGWIVSSQDVTVSKILEAQLRGAGNLDLLTGLPNRAALAERLQAAMAKDAGGFALLYIDFDRFKLVNDSLGHRVGDEMLKQIATRLRVVLASIERGDDAQACTPARLGGDEFVVLLERADLAEACRVAERLVVEFAQPLLIEGRSIVSTASIGLVADDGAYTRAEDVVRDADTAMYEAKHRGRSQFAVFDAEMRERARRRLELETDLRSALQRDELELQYQPIVSLEDGRMVSAEALVRWEHPKHGSVSPGEFVALAEESCLILPLGDWVVRTAFWRLATFHAQGHGDFRISINLSRQQLLSKEWIERLPNYATDAGIEPADVQFEITEGTVMRDIEASSAALKRLREMGFKLAIDDFGTGYSSLSCLHQFPIDVLKMDRELTLHLERGQEYVGMVNAIMLLAWNLGIRVVAEGVETLDHMQMLQGLNCHYAQGFYFGKAVSADQLFLKPAA